MSDRSTNRHGIPLQGPRPRTLPQCCWPKCKNRVGSLVAPPLCDQHVYDVYDHVTSSKFYMAGIGYSEKAKAAYEQPAEPEQPPPPPAPRMGTIYFIRVGGHIKIGWTSNLAKRMRQYAPDTILLATCPGTRKDENQLHKRFAVHRTFGREWYALVPPILEHIKSLVREHGEPEAVDFGARPVEVPRPHQLRQGPTPRGWVPGRGEVRAG